MDAPANLDHPTTPLPLEAVELELALQAQDDQAQPIAERLPDAIVSAGGELLFEMSSDDDEAFSWMAAVSFGSGENRQLAIVTVPADGGPARVEAADSCDLPLARIAAAYAGLMDHFRIAA